MRFDYGKTPGTSAVIKKPLSDNPVIFKLDKGSGYIDNVLYKSWTYENYSTDLPLYIFGSNHNGVYNYGTRFFGRVYYAKIWDNDALVRNLIPCYRKTDNAVGMYDTVNGVFYTNQGTGEFLKGADKADSFEPYNKYKIPILVNGTNNETIYLNAPLADGESINYKADNLPDIVLNKGSNTITTDTAVKPKKISAKYYKK